MKATGRCTVVVGGQFGSEGKGKVVSLLAQDGEPWVVRCGGPNSGHTTRVADKELIVRQVPAGVSNSNATLLVAAGCVVDEDLLLKEIETLRVDRDQIVVDPRAVLLEPSDRTDEQDGVFRIGSTASGTGAALIRRMRRGGSVRLVESSSRLRQRCRIETVAGLLHRHLDSGGHVIVEGTQGFGLSLLHSPLYPFTTSRDTTAAAFCMETGLSPRAVTDTVLVLRTYPIRVGGNSGPMNGELSWDIVRERSGAPAAVPEFTSVTKRLRRVGEFDFDLVRNAVEYNRPTSIALMGLDRLDYANTGVESAEHLSGSARDFILRIEQMTGVPVEWVGTGFGTFDAINIKHQQFRRGPARKTESA